MFHFSNCMSFNNHVFHFSIRFFILALRPLNQMRKSLSRQIKKSCSFEVSKLVLTLPYLFLFSFLKRFDLISCGYKATYHLIGLVTTYHMPVIGLLSFSYHSLHPKSYFNHCISISFISYHASMYHRVMFMPLSLLKIH